MARLPPSGFPPWPRCGGKCGGAPCLPEGAPALRAFAACKTVSETNRRDRWGLQERKKAQREAALEAVSVALAQPGNYLPERGPWYVRYTRVSSSRIHDEGANLPPALKAVEDQVCACLKVDDGDDAYQPAYRQEPLRGRAEGVLVEVWGDPS